MPNIRTPIIGRPRRVRIHLVRHRFAGVPVDRLGQPYDRAAQQGAAVGHPDFGVAILGQPQAVVRLDRLRGRRRGEGVRGQGEQGDGDGACGFDHGWFNSARAA
jgi:hypothetical protein